MAKKKSKKKVIIIIGIMVVILIAIIIGFSAGSGARAIKVTTTKVDKRTITQTVSAIGKIEPETEVKISSQTSGEIIYLGVREGDTVKSNQLLVRIKPDIIETQLEQYEAAAEAVKMEIETRKAEMERSKAALQRITELYKKEFASQEEFDRSKAAFSQAESGYRASLSQYEQALASLKQIKRSAERTVIYSPMGGVITKLSVEKGEKVLGTEMMQGTEMMIVSDLSIMNAVVEVDENDISLVHIGDTTKIEIDAFPDHIYKGIVIEIGHSAIVGQLGTQDQVTNFEVKIRILDIEPRLRPGMSCNVEIQTETRPNVIAVPLQAVTIRDTNINRSPDVNEDGPGIRTVKKDEEMKQKVTRPPAVVFLKNGKFAKMVSVKTGISDKGFIEITEGLKEGDEIISGSFMAVSKELQDKSLILVDSAKGKKSIKK